MDVSSLLRIKDVIQCRVVQVDIWEDVRAQRKKRVNYQPYFNISYETIRHCYMILPRSPI